MKRTLAVLLMIGLLCVAALAQTASTPAPAAQAQKVMLKVNGAVTTPLALTAADWAKLPRATVAAHRGHKPELSQFEGVLLKTLLEKAGVLDPKNPLKGHGYLRYVLVKCDDDYKTLFSLAELDEATGATTNVLLADKVNGEPLEIREGPLQLIVPSDKRQARSARMVVEITVVSVE
jgi:DMSO/TMAO reductase YedYZ molybdopterin-dependent catalytic subunit